MSKTTTTGAKKVNLAKIMMVIYGYDEDNLNQAKSLASRKVKGIREKNYMIPIIDVKEIVSKMANAKTETKGKAGAKKLLEDFKSIEKIEGIYEETIPAERDNVSPFVLKRYFKELIEASKKDIEAVRVVIEKIKKEIEEKNQQ